MSQDDIGQTKNYGELSKTNMGTHLKFQVYMTIHGYLVLRLHSPSQVFAVNFY